MPTPLIKKYAEQTKKSVAEVEAIWDQAKEAADNAFRGAKGPKYWAYVNGIVRKRLKLSESQTFKEFVEVSFGDGEVNLAPAAVETSPTEATPDPNNGYARFIGCLFSARDKAHELHLATKSYAEHMALNELYDNLVDTADEMAEMFQGKHGVVGVSIPAADVWNQSDAKSFIVAFTDWLSGEAKSLIGFDSFIVNKYEELVGDTYRTKYKLENLG